VKQNIVIIICSISFIIYSTYLNIVIIICFVVIVVKKTWGMGARHIKFFSDKDDSSIPTVTLGIPNTERGACNILV